MKGDFSQGIILNKKTTLDALSFLKSLQNLPVREREDSLLKKMLKGGIPAVNFNYERINCKARNTKGKLVTISFWVSPDYLSIGNDSNFIRMPLTPQAAQLIADHFNCVLPTSKMVDEIYKAAVIKLPPIALTEARDSLATFIKHNQLIEAQLATLERKGIIAGLKKDVVQSMDVLQNKKANRVAIYGWHTPDGKPIQALYTGHVDWYVDWYVDYSHGVRLVYEKMMVNKKIKFVKDVLNDPNLSAIICKDSVCKAMRYPSLLK